MNQHDYFWGLGYHPTVGQRQDTSGSIEENNHRHHHEQRQIPPPQHSHQQQPAAESHQNPVESFMAHYVQQCLDYHNVQLQQTQQQQQHHHQADDPPTQGDDNNSLQFLPATNDDPSTPTTIIVKQEREDEEPPLESMTTSTLSGRESHSESTEGTTATTTTSSTDTNIVIKTEPGETETASMMQTKSPLTDIETVAMEARARAMAVIQSFSKTPTQSSLEQQYHGCPSSISITTATTATPTSECYVRRQQCLEQEQQRKEKALLKNFAYVVEREEQRLARALGDIEQAKQLELDLAQRHAALLEERKKRLHQHHASKAGFGIGTEQRQRLDNKRQRSQQQQQQQERSGVSSAVAIYVSGLSAEIADEALRPWFGAYGKLRKIHIYRDKETGKAKGDALVVYQAEHDPINLIQTVCEQVRLSFPI